MTVTATVTVTVTVTLTHWSKPGSQLIGFLFLADFFKFFCYQLPQGAIQKNAFKPSGCGDPLMFWHVVPRSSWLQLCA